ncbi:MAG: PAS domain-containing sensor histidine kinase, partial [Segetibacter sp.]
PSRIIVHSFFMVNTLADSRPSDNIPPHPAIAEKEDFFKLLVNNSSSVYLLTDAALIFTYSSAAVKDLLGYTPEEILGMNSVELVHPLDKEHVKNMLSASISEPNKTFVCEYRVRDKQGTYVWIENSVCNLLESSGINAIVMNIKNIQSKKFADEALMQAEQRLSLLLNNTAESFILLNSRLRIVTYNKAAQEQSPFFYGRPLQSAISVLDLINKDEIPDYLNLFEQVFKGQEIERESNFVDLKENAHIYSHTFRPIMNNEDDIDGVFITSKEITEKKKIENEQQALTEELVKNNQDLQQFSFITSHNLRTPVANLLSLLSLYNKENPLDEFNQLLIEKSEQAAQQLNQTLSDLLNLLVIKSASNIDREPISFTDVFIMVKKNIDSLLQQQKGVIYTDFSIIDQIQYNRIHLESIFLNMLSNAIRYRSPDRNPVIKICSYKTDNWAVVEFVDNGLGMDLDRYGDRLFGLYQRFHGNIEGKGFGLYMIRSQITAMGGKIEVESEPGVGTRFKVYFKLQQ